MYCIDNKIFIMIIFIYLNLRKTDITDIKIDLIHFFVSTIRQQIIIFVNHCK
jgi:hypothetical protein